MKKLVKCARCGAEPRCLTLPSGRKTNTGNPINYFEVACKCGNRTGRSVRKTEVYDDWNAKQECLLKGWKDD